MKKKCALEMFKVFPEHSFLVYCAPMHVFSDNGSHLSAKLLQFLFSSLNVRNMFKKTHHSRTNGTPNVSIAQFSIASGVRQRIPRDLARIC